MSVTERIERLLDQMTLEEKVAQTDMIRGVTMATKVHPAHFCSVDPSSDFYRDRVDSMIGPNGIGFVHDVYSTPDVLNRLQRYFVEKTRLGIPCIFTGEALHGICYPGASSFPMPIGLGASFDPEMTKAIGHAIAAETRALGIHEILAPNLDVARDPRWGRMEETFGEDTCLSSAMARAIVSGEQGDSLDAEDTIACEPKHYLAHGFPEGGLNCGSARAGEREIRSEYLPVFAAGVQDSGAWNIMAAYHNIDGIPLISSKYYLTDIMKGELGLKGYIRSDFGAVNRLRTQHRMTVSDEDSIALAVNAGLDVTGFDFSNEFWQTTLCKLVREGRVSMDRINDAVRRILRVKFELGLFEHPYTDENRHKRIIRSEAHKALNLEAARESMVLLKNDGILPLKPGIRKIALLGPSSSHQRLGSYSSVPYGYHVPSLYERLQEMLPDTEILQEDGCGVSVRDYLTVPAEWLPGGVDISYYADENFSSEPVGRDRCEEIRFNWGLAKPHPALPFDHYGVRMKGVLCADKKDFDGQLILPCKNGVRLRVDGKLLIDSTGDHRMEHPSADFRFEKGVSHPFEIEFIIDESAWNVTFAYSAYGANTFENAIRLAEQADLSILVCGDDTLTSGEGMDRCGLTLYGRQRELVKRVGELGKPLVLVLEVGKPVDLTEEEPLSNAILLPWFGGELGAQAIAEALLGKVNPSGHLPVSFPKNIGHLPCYYSRLPGSSEEYLEGRTGARYPFGHGLSYTTFDLDHTEIKKTGKYCAEVRMNVKNTGSRDGTAVVQLYTEDPESSVVTPDMRLSAFARVPLKAGETRTVTLGLDEKAFRLMNERRQWVIEPGKFVIHAGFSCADIRESVSVEME